MPQTNDYEMWTRFVEAKYLIDAKSYEGKCPKCNSPRDCNNYYCLICKVGGLCPTTFRGNGAHTRHRWLQVRRQSHKSAVDPEDLAKYLQRESTDHIQKCLLNTGSLCYLRTDHQQASGSSRPPAKRAKTGRGQPSPLKSCEACNKAIANSQDCKQDFLLCSVECLIKLAQRQPRKNLLQMRVGALAPTHKFPQTALEKIKGRLRGSSSKLRSKPAAVINDRSGISSGGENIAARPPAVRGSSGRRSAPVKYRELHRGGSGSAAVINDRSGISSGGENIAARRPPAVRGSSGRRSAPVKYRELHRGGGAGAAAVINDRSGISRGGENIAARPPAVRGSSGRRSAPVKYRELHRGGAGSEKAAAAGTRAVATTAERTRKNGGGSSRRGPANRTQAAPDYSAYPVGFRCPGLYHLIAATKANGDWDQYLGNLVKD